MTTKKINNKIFIIKDYKNPKYKEIVYEGKTYQYEQSENSYGNVTYFYDGTKYYSHYKYLLFGPIIITIQPKFVFKVYGHIESEYFSKNDVRNSIKEKVDIINRKKEIKRGEII